MCELSNRFNNVFRCVPYNLLYSSESIKIGDTTLLSEDGELLESGGLGG